MIYSFVPVIMLSMAGMIIDIDEKNRILAYLLISYLAAFVFLAIFKVRYRLLAEHIAIFYSAFLMMRIICRFRKVPAPSPE